MTRKIPNLRWWIVGMMFVATVINYVDRQAFSILARDIQNALQISDLGYSDVVQAFLVAYALAYLLAGRVTDWLGTRASISMFIAWWSIADMLTAAAQSLFSLGAFRFLLGIGEPGIYTGYSKAISEWFPPEERGLAFGVCTAGATAGATLAVPMIAFLGARHGWRAAFLLTGAVGLLWIIPWIWLYRLPGKHPRITEKEWRLTAGFPRQPVSNPLSEPEWRQWKRMLTERNTVLLTLIRFLTDPVWYFYLFWFPKYLIDVRSMSLIRVGEIAWVVYLAADAGTILGGWASSALIKRGVPTVAARKRIMVIAAIIVPLTPLVAFVPGVLLELGIASIVVLAQLAWQVTVGTLIIDLYPQRSVATAFGIIAAGSGLGGFLSTDAVGHLVTHFSYKPVFVLLALLHPCALLLVWKIRSPLSLRSVEA